jgi:hypothetical protein
MIGFGLAAAPLSYAVPSEIVPRRWRSGQSAIDIWLPRGAYKPFQRAKDSSICLVALELSRGLLSVSELLVPSLEVRADMV